MWGRGEEGWVEGQSLGPSPLPFPPASSYPPNEHLQTLDELLWAWSASPALLPPGKKTRSPPWLSTIPRLHTPLHTQPSQRLPAGAGLGRSCAWGRLQPHPSPPPLPCPQLPSLTCRCRMRSILCEGSAAAAPSSRLISPSASSNTSLRGRGGGEDDGGRRG